MSSEQSRVIGTYTGKHEGPLLVCLGGMHGNERAGLDALNLVFQMLDVEPSRNPDFKFYGKLIGIACNIKAIQTGQRYIDKDLNRQWMPENVKRIFKAEQQQLDAEDREMKEILEIIYAEIKSYRPQKMIVLDLHTTSAYGGIFTIVNHDPESLAIGAQLHAPVIKGLIDGLQGTTLHYFVDDNFPIKTVALTFEAGQHYEKVSMNRTIAAIINCMRTIGSVNPESVENRHDQLLQEFSAGLPKVSELISTHPVQDPDLFKLLPGLKNFQKLKKGQLLGYDKSGPIICPEDCLLLMPKYQAQGSDGFFLIRDVNEMAQIS